MLILLVQMQLVSCVIQSPPRASGLPNSPYRYYSVYNFVFGTSTALYLTLPSSNLVSASWMPDSLISNF